ncbi:MAG: glycosyltransferase family 2 protein [Limisphaerales bacterium]
MKYILLTSAKNEEDYIAKALESVVRQSVLPVAWVIVDDASTDRTGSIIQTYAARHSFIHGLSAGSGEERNFGSKDKAIQAAYARVKGLAADFVGVQDADVAPEDRDYYETVLRQFDRDPRLGLTGGCVYERVGEEWQHRMSSWDDSIPGCVQMFRRECFERIGGFQRLDYGGSDTAAQLEVERLGWKAYTCRDRKVWHYRTTSSAGGVWQGCFRSGLCDASFGCHPVFEVCKCLHRLPSPPFGGSMVRLCGYFWWKVVRREPLISRELVSFLRRREMTKLRRTILPFQGRYQP